MTELKPCPSCTGEKHFVFAKYCETHDVCSGCGIHRKELKEIPWGCREGAFLCRPCMKQKIEKRIAQRREDGFDHDYTNEITCPSCGYEFSDSWEHDDGEKECPDCECVFHVEVNREITYSTEIIRK